MGKWSLSSLCFELETRFPMESYGRPGHYTSSMLWFGTMLFGMERLTSPKKWRLEPRIFLNVNGNPSFPLLSLSHRRLFLSYGAATTFKGVMFAIVVPLVPMFHTEAHNLPFRILNEQKLVPETLLRNVSGNCFHSDLICALDTIPFWSRGSKMKWKHGVNRSKARHPVFSKLCEQIVKEAKKRRCKKLQLDKTLSPYEVLQNASAELNN